jgi:imidazolonepropionase-like amidohydrolase
MNQVRFAAVGWTCAALLWSAPASADVLPAADAYAIVGGRVVLEPGKILDGASVLVRDGRIEGVGVDLPIPFDAYRIDAAGLVVHAGFLDAGNASGYDPKARPTWTLQDADIDVAAKSYAAAPEADRHLVTPEFRVARSLTADEDDWEKWRLCGFTGRLVKPSGGVLAGQSAFVSLRGRPLLDAVLKDRALMHVAFEVDGRQYPVTLMGAVAKLRQAFADAEHYRRREEFAAAKGLASLMPPSDASWIDLFPVLDGVQPVALRAQTEDEIHRALAVADELKFRLRIDGGREAWKLADRLARRGSPVLLSADFPDPPKHPSDKTPRRDEPRDAGEEDAEPPPAPPAEAPPDSSLPNADELDRPVRLVKDERRKWQENFQGVARLLEADIPVGLAFDGVPPDKFRTQIDRLVKEGGLNSDQILALLTTRAAAAIGVQDQLGAVAPGKRSHLVVRRGLWTEKDTLVRYVLVDDRLFEYPEPEAAAKPKPPDAKKAADAEEKHAEEARGPLPAAVPVELDSDRTPMRRTGGDALIRAGRLLTMGPLGNLDNADVRVRGGKIVEIGADLKPDESTVVVDARDWYVVPGIVDTHSHMAIAGGVNEYSLSVTPEVRVRDVVDSRDVTIYRALAGGVTTARLLHGSANTIGGQDAVVKLRWLKPAPELLLAEAPLGVKFALGENVTRNQTRFPNTRLGVEAVLVRAFAEADAYRKMWEQHRKRSASSTEPPPRRDLRLEALARVLEGEIGVHCHCYRADEILMLLGVADRFGIGIRSLQHGLEAYKIAPEVARHKCSVSTFSDWWAYKWEAYDATPYNAALLREAGVPVCLKSDSPNVVRTMYLEAAKLLRYGDFTPDAALETITIIPARQLRLDARIGSIEVGKDADLAMFNGHPLNTYARCEMTLVDGEIYFERRDSAGAADRVRSAAAPPPPPTRNALRYDLLPPREAIAQTLQIETNSAGRYALVGGDVYTVSGDVLKGGAVLVGDGRIEAVLPDGSEIDEPDATIVDVKGLRIYPGLIDAGCKVGLAEVDSTRETLDFEEIGPFQPDLRAAAAIHPDSALIPVTRAGGVTTVVAMPTGGVVSGQSALVQLAGWVPSEMVLVDPLALHLRLPSPPKADATEKRPFDGRGRFAHLRDRRIQEIRSLVRLARHYDRAVRESKARRTAPPTVDPRLEALAPYVRKERPVVIYADSTKDILEALRLAEELDLKLILQGGRDAWKLAEVLRRRDVPVVAGPVLALPSQRHDPYDAAFANLAKLHAAGVRFCIQTDDASNSRNLPFHAAVAVAFGLPPDEGLKAVTLYPAQIFGFDDLLGSIEPGKVANLILADGDPLQCSTRIKHLFIGGNPVPPVSKHTELYEKYRQRLKNRAVR